MDTWRSKSIPTALARWVSHSLGDGERRRRLLAWRNVLSSQQRRPCTAGFNLSAIDGNRRDGLGQARCAGVQESIDKKHSKREARWLAIRSSPLLARPPPPRATMAVGAGPAVPATLHITRDAGGVLASGIRAGGAEAIGATDISGRLELGEERHTHEHDMGLVETQRTAADGEGEDALSSSLGSLPVAFPARHVIVRTANAATDGSDAQKPDKGTTHVAQAETVRVDVCNGGFVGEHPSPRENVAGPDDVAHVGMFDLRLCATLDRRSVSQAEDGDCRNASKNGKESPLLVRDAVAEVRDAMSNPSDFPQGMTCAAAPSERTVVLTALTALDGGGAGHAAASKGSEGRGVYKRDNLALEEPHEASTVPAIARCPGNFQHLEGADVPTKTTIATSTASINVSGAWQGMRDELDGMKDSIEWAGASVRIKPAAAIPAVSVSDASPADANSRSAQAHGDGATRRQGYYDFVGAENCFLSLCKEEEAGGTRILSAPTSAEKGGSSEYGPSSGNSVRETNHVAQHCPFFLDETATMVGGGAMDTGAEGCQQRCLSPDQVNNLLQGGMASDAWSLPTSTARLLGGATALEPLSTKVVPFSAATVSGANELCGGHIAGPDVRGGFIDSMEQSTIGVSGSEHRRCNQTVHSGGEGELNDGGVVPLSWASAPHDEGTQIIQKRSLPRSLSDGCMFSQARPVRDPLTVMPDEGMEAIIFEPSGRRKDFLPKQEEEGVEGRVCVLGGRRAGVSSCPDVDQRCLRDYGLVDTSAPAPDTHPVRARFCSPSVREGLESQALENTETAELVQGDTVQEEGDNGVVTCTADLAISGGEQHDYDLGEEGGTADGVVESPILRPELRGTSDSVLAEETRLFPSQPPINRGNSTGGSTVDSNVGATVLTVEITRRGQSDYSRSYSTPTTRQTWPSDRQPEVSSLPLSSSLGVALVAVGAEEIATKSALPEEHTVAVRGTPQQQRRGRPPSCDHSTSSASDSSKGQPGALLALPDLGRAPSSELSSISWSERGEDGGTGQHDGLRSTENGTARHALDDDNHDINCSSKSLMLAAAPFPALLPENRNDVDAKAGLAQPHNCSQSSRDEHCRGAGAEYAIPPPLTDAHVSTSQTSAASIPSPAAGARPEDHGAPQIEHRVCVVQHRATEESSRMCLDGVDIFRPDGGGNYKAKIAQGSPPPEISSPDRRRHHDCVDATVATDSLQVARRAQEKGHNGTVDATAHVDVEEPAASMKARGEVVLLQTSVEECGPHQFQVPRLRSFAGSGSDGGYDDGSCDYARVDNIGRCIVSERTSDSGSPGHNVAIEGGLPEILSTAAVAVPARHCPSTGPLADGVALSLPASRKPCGAGTTSTSYHGKTHTSCGIENMQMPGKFVTDEVRVARLGGMQSNADAGLQVLAENLFHCAADIGRNISRVSEGNNGDGGDSGSEGGRSRPSGNSGGDGSEPTLTHLSATSSGRRSRGTLSERVSEACLRRRLQAIGLR